MKIVMALAVCFALSVFAKDRTKEREPAQATGFPNYPGLPATPTTGTPANPSNGTFNTEDILTAGATGASTPQVQSIVCLLSGAQPYTINTSYGNDIRVSRVSSAGGPISYEVYRGQKFLAACPAISVQSR